MFCPNCRTINPDDGRYCKSCRAVLPALGGTATVGISGGSAVTGPLPAVPSVAGVTLAGRYALLSILGQGGMGLVYRATDLELEQEIAIKVLHPALTADPDALARFKREVITARAITHPNVIRIHDFGVATNSTPGIPGQAFISMELLPGGTLADRIIRGPVPLPEALSIGAALCEGLQAAHAQGVIHRDLKPQNVL